jgi:hypothetical protein
MFKIIDWFLLDRETYELGILNEIHESFNEKRITPMETRKAIYSHKWKYQHQHIDFLIFATYVQEKLFPKQ